MVNFKILAGGYDAFIATYVFDSATSSLALTARSPAGYNPSWLATNPLNSSVIYTVNELDQGTFKSFTVDSAGILSPAISTVPTGGGSPCFAVALSSGAIAAVNYMGGNARVVPIAGQAANLVDSGAVINFTVPAGGESHPHHVVEWNNELFIPDKGADTIWRLRKNSKEWAVAGSIRFATGNGPRHSAIRGDRIFTLHENSNYLTLQRIPSIYTSNAPLIANVSIVPSATPPGAVYGAAEILYPLPTRRFPTSYIYVTNRNIGVPDPEKGDSIAIFEHVNIGTSYEGLKLIKQVYTGLSQVRGVEIGRVVDGGEEYLVAAGVAGTGGVKVFKRISGGRDLVEVAKNVEVPTRTSFVWI